MKQLFSFNDKMESQMKEIFLFHVLVAVVAGYGPKYPITRKFQQPNLLAIPSSAVVEKGAELSFLCLSNNAGTSRFYKDGKEVEHGDAISLAILHAHQSDSGRYSCRVEVGGKLSEPSPGHDILVIDSSPHKTSYKSLHKDIMRKSSLALPQTRVDRSVKVKLRLALTQILDVDTDNNVITLVLRKEETWINPVLSWDLAQYNVTHVAVRAAKMWFPDTVPYNLVSRVERLSPPLIVLDNNGTLISVQMLKLSVDSDTAGYDTYSGATGCIMFGSWNYHGELLELKDPTEDSFSVEDFSKVSKYEVLKSSQECEKGQSLFSCIKQPYQYIKFNFRFRLKGKRSI